MKTIFKQTSNITAVDKFNMKMCKSLQTAVGKSLTVTKAAIGEDADKDGEAIQTACIITDEGAYGTISATAMDLVDSLIDMLEEIGEPITVRVEARKTQNNREYLVLVIE